MRLCAALLILALAACETAPLATVPDATDDESRPAESAEETGAQETVVKVPPLPSEKPAIPSLPLKDLVGIEGSEVLALLGQPRLREDRSPGVAWIYDGTDCRFGLLLYPDLETNRRIVLSVETDGGPSCSARAKAP